MDQEAQDVHLLVHLSEAFNKDEVWQLAAAAAWSKATNLERVLIRGSTAAKQLKLVDVLIRKTSAAGLGVGSAPGADGRHLAWVAVPLMVLALVVDRGVSTLDDIKQCAKLFIARNDVALATAYHGVRGVGVVASVGLGVVAAVRACVKRLKVQPGRPRVSRLKRPKQQLDLAPAGVLPAARTSTTGQVNASQDG
ncbi:hypothetical protein CHLRE_03g190281v5 [Chlamydomonas reinhardtii]|uniref:Uncharacterized protein n=1 Tax=Chlamydomonas reinhardtii TaxID=3055 RepID=A0A2K3DYD4_CHLRE|nr:uncharacterized protein CHLRE_03g190281v5 [Chlamydomonas reinhardtii]PNW85517.1 hypothetical protein CHLRE_03g190281v5 [Chlamydomonas reinhardtii]